MTKEFYKEIRKRNKDKFIALRSKEIEAQQKGVDIPAFMYAQQEYNTMLNNGLVNHYGEVMKVGA